LWVTVWRRISFTHSGRTYSVRLFTRVARTAESSQHHTEKRGNVNSSSRGDILSNWQAMKPERSEQIRRILAAARERSADERSAFLDSACTGDEALRREIETLLASEVGDTTQTMVGVGTQLGPYKLEARLGAGGMGEVFRATDTRLHRSVAIKILPHDKVADADRKRRFLQEARAASALIIPISSPCVRYRKRWRRTTW
jgi:hypothetical protein